jgi:hypothetical protein
VKRSRNNVSFKYVDADDYVDLSIYQKLVEIADQNSLDAIFCGYTKILKDKKLYHRQLVDRVTLYSGEEIKEVILNMIGAEPSFPRDYRFEMSSCMGLYLRSTIIRHSVRFCSERELISEDLIFNIDFLSNAQKVAFVPDCLYYYRYNKESFSLTYRSDRFTKDVLLHEAVCRRLSSISSESKYLVYAQRGFLGRVKVFLLREIALFKPGNGKKTLHNIAMILHHDQMEKIITNYPFHKLPFYNKVFFYFLIRKNTWIIAILCVLNHFRNQFRIFGFKSS